MKLSEMKNGLGVKVVGIYRPAGTSYAIYEAKLKNGDTFAGGAFSEKEFRTILSDFHSEEEIVSVRKLPAKDLEDGWKEVKNENF